MIQEHTLKISESNNQEIYKYLQWILSIYRLGQDANEKYKKIEIYQLILEQIVVGFSADSGSLAFLTEDKNGLNLVAGIDLPSGVIGSVVPVVGSRMGAVIKSCKPSLLNDDCFNKKEDCTKPGQKKSSRVTSSMCWPLWRDGNVIGALNINRGNDSQPYGEDNLADGKILIELINVVLENTRLHKDYQKHINELKCINEEMKEINNKLESTQNQLLQSEKLASIGQLAAGVAHEINNPVGYINSNVSSLKQYLKDLLRLLEGYEQLEGKVNDQTALNELRIIKEDVDLAYLKQDIADLINESQEGITRVKRIVQDLKDFSHVDEAEWQWADLHKGLDSTLNVAQNETKYKAEVIKEYGEIPLVECMPSQLNQVFMNLIVNATHAIEDRGVITLRTGREGECVWVTIADTGKGMSDEVQKHMFEPFYTTKPVGSGTGLGLSLSYGIIEKHRGRIEVKSEVGNGTTFTLWLPIQQAQARQAG